MAREYPDLQYGIKNGEAKVGWQKLKVDGYSELTDTAFEFDGCFYHGCTCKDHKGYEKKMKERRDKTAEKHRYLRQACNELIVMKECDFQPTFAQPCATTMTTDFLIKQICEDNIFGAVVCDISVPESLRDHFAEMTPVFKNVSVSISDVGTYMKGVCDKFGEMKTNRRMLIGSYFGNQIMVASPLLKWYHTHGLKVNNVTAFIEYEPVACFQGFTEEISNARRKADSDQSGTAAGNTAKLIGKLIFFYFK
jgi:hypothetical protein